MTTDSHATESPVPPPLMFDSHVHTYYCRHASGELHEYAMEAFMRNLRGMIFTCHAPMPVDWASGVRMELDEYYDYLAEIDETARSWADLITVCRGLECDYVPGLEFYLPPLLEASPLDYVLGSVHPQFPEYRERYYRDDDIAFQRTYFLHLAQAAESHLFDALSHPELIRELFPSTWDYSAVSDTVCHALDRIAATGVAMELNTSSARRQFQQMSPGPEILAEMALRGIPVVVGSDAHVPSRVGDLFAAALDVLEDAGYREITYFQARKPRLLSIAEARISVSR